MQKLVQCLSLLLLASCTSSTVTINGVTYKVIKGMDAGSIHTSFTRKGFLLHKDLNREPIQYICTKYNLYNEMKVIITGKGPTEITKMTAFYASDENKFNEAESADFLGYVATSPYDDNSPSAAKDWVRRKIQSSFADTTINGVDFLLERSGNKQTISLNPAVLD